MPTGRSGTCATVERSGLYPTVSGRMWPEAVFKRLLVYAPGGLEALQITVSGRTSIVGAFADTSPAARRRRFTFTCIRIGHLYRAETRDLGFPFLHVGQHF